MPRKTVCRLISICAGTVLVSAIAFAAQKPAAKGDAAKGKAVFEQCAVCHSADSTAKGMGPGLKGLFKRSRMADRKPMNEANVRGKIDSGGSGMPPYKEMLSSKEKDDLIAYLKTL